MAFSSNASKIITLCGMSCTTTVKVLFTLITSPWQVTPVMTISNGKDLDGLGSECVVYNLRQ